MSLFPVNLCKTFPKFFECVASGNWTNVSNTYCVTQDFEADNTSRLVVGLCELAYSNYSQLLSMLGPRVSSVYSNAQLNDLFCGPTHRNGTLCSHCQAGFTIDVNSPLFECIPISQCSDVAWLLYIFEQILPLTIVFMVVMVLQVSLFSPRYRSMVLVSQVIALPVNIMSINYGLTLAFHSSPPLWMSKVLSAMYDPLNLNVPSFLLPPSCFSNNLNVLEVIFLEYLKAVYPLLLCALLYILIELHGCNCRLVVLAWKPFSRSFSRFRRRFNPKTSIMDVFATFVLLTYMKFIMVSVVITLPTRLLDTSGEVIRHVLFFDGSIQFFGSYHLKFVSVIFIFYIVLVILLVTFLFLYQTRLFQRFLMKCHLREVALMTIIDIIQGHYKDGTDGTRDLRFFAGIYSILQLLLVVLRCLATVGDEWIFYSVLTALLSSALFFCVKPYKCQWNNTFNGVSFLYQAAIWCLYLLIKAKVASNRNVQLEILIMYVLFFVPALYFAVLIAKSLYISARNYRKPLASEQRLLNCSFADRLTSPGSYEYQPIMDNESVWMDPDVP